MKIAVRIVALVLVCFVALQTCPAQKYDDGLLAAPYPGSTADTNPGIFDASWKKVVEARSRRFYTRDPFDKVKAYYTKSLGEFEEVASENMIYNRRIVPFSDVVDIVTKRGGVIGEGGENFYGGTFSGVTLYGPTKTGASNYSVTKVYEALDKSYCLRFMDADGGDHEKMLKRLEDPELKQVKARHEHLKTAFFMQTSQKRKDNAFGALSMDEVLYDRYYTSAEENRQRELQEIQTKYNAAMAQMKYDEATKLGERMLELGGVQPDPKKDWDTAIRCLEEMEKHAYTTLIVIDTHPSKWDLTPPKQ